MSTLEGKRVLVAGGTGSVGRHIVDAVVAAGGTAVVPSRSTEKLDELVGRRGSAEQDRVVPLLGNIADDEAPAVVRDAGPLDGAVVSIGAFVPAEGGVLASSPAELQRAFDGSVAAHLAVARALVPVLEPRGGGYVTIQGPLAFEPLLPATGLVSVAAAAQDMLARVLMTELTGTRLRLNQLVIYASLGWGSDDESRVSGADIGRYTTYLLTDAGASVHGRTIHLMSSAQVPA